MIIRQQQSSFWGQQITRFVSYWCRLKVVLGSSWGHFAGRFGAILGSSWDHLGLIPGSSWDYFLVSYCLDSFANTKWSQRSPEAPQTTFRQMLSNATIKSTTMFYITWLFSEQEIRGPLKKLRWIRGTLEKLRWITLYMSNTSTSQIRSSRRRVVCILASLRSGFSRN